jgi:hypothetical protein
MSLSFKKKKKGLETDDSDGCRTREFYHCLQKTQEDKLEVACVISAPWRLGDCLISPSK